MTINFEDLANPEGVSESVLKDAERDQVQERIIDMINSLYEDPKDNRANSIHMMLMDTITGLTAKVGEVNAKAYAEAGDSALPFIQHTSKYLDEKMCEMVEGCLLAVAHIHALGMATGSNQTDPEARDEEMADQFENSHVMLLNVAYDTFREMRLKWRKEGHPHGVMCQLFLSMCDQDENGDELPRSGDPRGCEKL